MKDPVSLGFSTKARTLESLSGRLASARVAPLFYFCVEDWTHDPQVVVRRLHEALPNTSWIVRSSCSREDGIDQSNAGAFESILNVLPQSVVPAIAEVIASYGADVIGSDEILVQPMLKNVVRSGVAFSHDPSTCTPYRVINWVEGDDTAAVTGGSGGRFWQQAALSPLPAPPQLAPVIVLLEELLEKFGGRPVDCEFAVTRDRGRDILWLLQARPLILSRPAESAERQATRLRLIEKKVARGLQPHPFLIGQRTVYGVMPDWNPAEIIGIRPKPLALSLYRDLVTDAIWAYQRHNYGYRNLRSFPLMPNFFGQPYIDVRLSFNSFVPADLDDGLASRLVDYYIDRLLSEPTLHDKVEFEIVYSCYTLDLPDRLARLREAGFSSADETALANSLRHLTNRVVHSEKGLWREDAAKLNTLRARRAQLQMSGADPLERIYWLLEDGKRYGTLPFAGLARAGFMAVQVLKSLVAVGVFSDADYDAFIGSLSTVSGQLARDRAILDRSNFLSRYGHLRPGTYDLESPRYDEEPDRYFDWGRTLDGPEAAKPFSLTVFQMREIARMLKEHGLDSDVVGLFEFLQAGIELREFAKFEFTQNLSDALSLMDKFGADYGFSRSDLAYCDVAAFRELHMAAIDGRDVLSRSIDQGKARYQESMATILPPVIIRPEDVWAFEWPETEPNFITQKSAMGSVVLHDQRDRLAGAIVCIPNADPGFDWLFSHGIAGLITAWGGANSHMAIRAGELGLPAVIGAGEVLYRKWSSASRLFIDCAGRRVELVA